jgi:hypothetical protein
VGRCAGHWRKHRFFAKCYNCLVNTSQRIAKIIY